MSDWSPSQYLRFAGHRLRPALDLLAQVPADQPHAVYDLGCGPGNVTRILAERWPHAAIRGLDSSAEMLVKAKAERDMPANISFETADLHTWTPASPADVLYSNAALQWLTRHEALFPRLLNLLRPGGTLAVQMPRNHAAPSHTSMLEAAANVGLLAELKPIMRLNPVAEPAFYYDLLAPIAAKVEIWETIYVQPLEGDNPVVEWTKGSALRPLLDALDEKKRAIYHAEYSRLIAAAYPQRRDGRTLLPFRRLFIVATR